MIELKPDPFLPIREDLIGALERYVNNHIRPGGFLEAVLANDLYMAVIRADNDNIRNLKNIVSYVAYYIPTRMLGSYESVNAHITKKGDKDNG